MKVDITERVHNMQDIVGWAIISAATAHEEKTGQKVVMEWPRDTDGHVRLDVKLMINGQEFPFEETLKSYEQAFDEQVHKAAVKLLEDKLNDLSNAVYSIEKHIVREAKDRLNLNIEED